MMVEEAVQLWRRGAIVKLKCHPSGVRFNYTNYKGETEDRHALPLSMRYGTSLWHPKPQWLVSAWDFDRNQHREFALADMRLFPVTVSPVSSTERGPHNACGAGLCNQPDNCNRDGECHYTKSPFLQPR